MPEEHDTRMLRNLMVLFMAVNVDVILQKCNTWLRSLFGWVDPEEGNAPGPFTYKEYMSCVLLEDSWEGQSDL